MQLRQAIQAAAAIGLDRLDAQLLLLHCLGRSAHDRAWVLAHDDEALTREQQAQYQQQCQRRAAGEPLAYIVGYKAFYGLRLAVDSRVLVPRPDTETLVDWALELIPANQAFKVLDLGTGSGAIALAIQHHRPQAQVSATDASEGALAVAQANALSLGLPVRFLLNSDPQNWFAPVQGERYHLIVSNPPYIAQGDAHLAALTHEPAVALTSGKDGLDDIRRIASDATLHSLKGAWLLLEHGFDQSAAVQDILRTHGLYRVDSRQDLAGHARCTGGQIA